MQGWLAPWLQLSCGLAPGFGCHLGGWVVGSSDPQLVGFQFGWRGSVTGQQLWLGWASSCFLWHDDEATVCKVITHKMLLASDLSCVQSFCLNPDRCFISANSGSTVCHLRWSHPFWPSPWSVKIHFLFWLCLVMHHHFLVLIQLHGADRVTILCFGS